MYTPPILAQKIDYPFDDERYIAEPKMDGFRLLFSTMDSAKAYMK